VVWEVVPVQYFQFRAGSRIYDGIPQSDVQNRRELFAEVHLFF
jgi:hypothetical protein